MSQKAIIVGEMNPHGPSLVFALYPKPAGCAGAILCHKILGLQEETYLSTFKRVNLLSAVDGPWSMARARKAADDEIVNSARFATWVLLGRKVAEAFAPHLDTSKKPSLFSTGFFKHDFDTSHRAFGRGCMETCRHNNTFVLLPHPSGRCREWSRLNAIETARMMLWSTRSLRDVHFGEAERHRCANCGGADVG